MVGILWAADESNPATLATIARDFSPRIEVLGPREVALDLAGVARLFGDAPTLAEELRRTAADRHVRARIAIAGTQTAGRLLVRHRAGLTVVAPGDERTALAPLRVELLATLVERTDDSTPPVTVLRQWGLRTLGEFVALPAHDVAARLGQCGVRWQRIAAGVDVDPFVPTAPDERFEDTLDLDWPIEGLEPLSFVFSRVMQRLCARLERRGRGAAVLYVRLHLVTRETHARALQLPVAMRDAKALCTLALLDLESHPPSAGIDRVTVSVDPTPERVVQFSLLTRSLPAPEKIATLMARLGALLGEGRCGAPQMTDSWRPGECALVPFTPRDVPEGAVHAPPTTPTVRRLAHLESPALLSCGDASQTRLATALRRFRLPVVARVRLERGLPTYVGFDRVGLVSGEVDRCAGPWRLSGAWWPQDPAPPGWDRDEWDVSLRSGVTYRLYVDRATHHWFADGIVD